LNSPAPGAKQRTSDRPRGRLLVRCLAPGLALQLILGLAFGGNPDALAEAQEHLQAERWGPAVELLQKHVARISGDALAHHLLGGALLELEDPDRGAYHLARAADIFDERGETRQAKRVRSALSRADPLNSRRERLFRDATTRLYKAAKELFEDGHAARALAILDALLPVRSGKDAGRLERLHGEVQSAFEEVDLDGAGAEAGLEGKDDDGNWPLVTLESEHYVLRANLEEEVVQLVADTMDDIHGYYVELYFDGDESAVPKAKATIRVHPTRESMLSNWSGGSAPEGWWSPGENQVTCYDTRTTTGRLQWMLETLFHEASHQFMSLLNRRGGRAPTWLNEGTSSFFEGAVAMADHRVLWPDAALSRLRNLAAALQSQSDEVTLEKVLGYAEGGSYPGSYYAWGWGLVYFMQQFEDPKTLRHSYRELYGRYRERMTRRGGDSRAVFEEIFLGAGSPLAHESLDDFRRDWKAWILDEVRPLHLAAKPTRRSLRMERVTRYIDAALEAADNRKAPVSEEELLGRALLHVEYVRSKIDGEDHFDLELIALQARIFLDLGHKESAAPLVALQLELADEGHWSPDEETYAALEKQLKKLDSRNYALRRAMSAQRGLSRSARKLLAAYEKAKQPLPLRAYTFAARMGAALDDREFLLKSAAQMRSEVRAAGLLAGEVHSLVAPRKRWMTIFNAEAKDFTQGDAFLGLAAVRPAGYINTAIELSEEYELRATFRRDGGQYRSTCHGLVIAGGEASDWLIFGLLKDGKAGLWRLALAGGGGVVTRKIESFYLEPPPSDDADLEVAVHIGAAGEVTIAVEGCETIETELPGEISSKRFAGIYVKDGRTELLDPVVELFP